MKHFGHKCLKRTLLWSSAPCINLVNLGPLPKGQHKSDVAVTKKYRDKNGKLRYHGLPALKGTQSRGYRNSVLQIYQRNPGCKIIVTSCLDQFAILRLYPVKFTGKILEERQKFYSSRPEIPEVLFYVFFHLHNSMFLIET